MNGDEGTGEALEMAQKIEATCPACAGRLEPMDVCSLGAVGVCPWCGELVRRTATGVRLYTEEEAADAHPEVLARLQEIQKNVKARASSADK